MLNKAEIGQLKEDKLRRQVIMPLLEAMRYEHVVEYHGPNERGRDVVACTRDYLDRRTNLAVVAKAVQLSGKAKVEKGSAAEVVFQILQCFNEGYLDTWNNEDQAVDRVWVVTNKTLHPDAQKAMNSALSEDQKRRVEYFGIEKLWKYYDKYMSAALARRIAEIRQNLTSLDPHYSADLILSGEQTMLAFREAFTGAARDKPFVIRGLFTFPDTDKGRQVRADYERHVRAGTSVWIPREYIESMELPPIVEKASREVLGIDRFEVGDLGLWSARDDRVLSLGIEVENSEGETFTIPRVDLRFAGRGTHEEVWNNEHEPSPFLVSLTEYHRDGTAQFHIQITDSPLNAVQYLSKLRLLQCVSKPAILRATALLTGYELPERRLQATIERVPTAGMVRMIADLATVQRRTGVPIPIKEGNISDDDRSAIAYLRSLVRGGGTLADVSELIKVPLPRRTAENVLQGYAGGKEHAFLLDGIESETLELFGVTIPLGRAQVHSPLVRLINESDMRKRLKAGSEYIEAEFRSIGKARFTIWYLGLTTATDDPGFSSAPAEV